MNKVRMLLFLIVSAYFTLVLIQSQDDVKIQPIYNSNKLVTLEINDESILYKDDPKKKKSQTVILPSNILQTTSVIIFLVSFLLTYKMYKKFSGSPVFYQSNYLITLP
ncbi:hypothetical protein [Neobacillus sp. LXY-4]|uniref:hypothetical protein n=1 Tax=Neobacillus sp. LXY-4 TaxID=3379826 RepID=UPI003EE1CF5B